jgi:hypothetical protein
MISILVSQVPSAPGLYMVCELVVVLVDPLYVVVGGGMCLEH